MIGPTLETLRLSDGYTAAARWWLPARPRGAVLYFHGIQSHGGWYEGSGQALADAGLAVLMPDRRGSGRNTHQRGHSASVEQCVDDAICALEALSQRTGFNPIHVVGVSWGGKLSVALATRAMERVASVSLVAPGFFSRLDLSRGEKFRVALSLIHERERLYDIPLNLPVLFTRNPERVDFVQRDDLRLMQVSASFLLATRRLDKTVRGFTHSGWRGGVHLFVAGRDQIIDNERCRAWLRGLPVSDRQITEYPEAEHTIEFEADPKPFYRDLTEWIVARCPPVGD